MKVCMMRGLDHVECGSSKVRVPWEVWVLRVSISQASVSWMEMSRIRVRRVRACMWRVGVGRRSMRMWRVVQLWSWEGVYAMEMPEGDTITSKVPGSTGCVERAVMTMWMSAAWWMVPFWTLISPRRVALFGGVGDESVRDQE